MSPRESVPTLPSDPCEEENDSDFVDTEPGDEGALDEADGRFFRCGCTCPWREDASDRGDGIARIWAHRGAQGARFAQDNYEDTPGHDPFVAVLDADLFEVAVYGIRRIPSDAERARWAAQRSLFSF